uniref:glycerol-3-phosphate dehydrogenase n=1 Tax=Seriola lalandi dorsalis TaxID=1841481 RepID=A0A3B4WSH8_SERLL
MVALTSRGHYCLCIACAEAAEQVTTVYMDEFPPRQAQAVALWSSQEFDGFIVGGGATESDLKTAPVQGDNFSSGTSSRKFLVPLVILLYLPSHVHFSFVGSSDMFALNDCLHRLGVTHIPLLWSCPPAAGQHNDARMNLAIALTAARYGAAIANYTEVVHLLKRADPQTGKERVCGALCRDVITGQEFDVRAKCVINATGPFTDALRKMDDQKNPDICQPSAGVHIVIPGKGCPNTPTHGKSHPVEEEDMDFILTEVHNYEAASART